MGKIKGWKKWEHKGKKVIVYSNINTDKAIGISFVPEHNIWEVKYSLNKNSIEFKTKKQALDYAINYMRWKNESRKL